MVIREIRASYAFIERSLNLMKRYIGWEIVFFLYNIINTLSIALIGVAMGDPKQVLYLTIGAVLWGFLSLLFHEIGWSIAWERWEGTIEFTLMAPIKRITHLAGTSIAAIVYGLLRTLLILIAVGLFLNLRLENANIAAAALILAVSSFSFIGLGLIAAVFPLLSPEKGPQATHILQGIILLVSGIYYEIEILPGWLQTLSKLSPATYTLKAMRAALLDGAGFREISGHLAILTVMGFILVPLGYFTFKAGERFARRTGRLSRNG